MRFSKILLLIISLMPSISIQAGTPDPLADSMASNVRPVGSFVPAGPECPKPSALILALQKSGGRYAGASDDDAGLGLKGILNGKPMCFEENVVKDDGDCGFHALGISRTEAVSMLLGVIDREDIRKLVGFEIKSGFMEDSLPASMKAAPEYMSLKSEYEKAQADLDKAVRELNNAMDFPEGERKDLAGFQAFFREHETDDSGLLAQADAVLKTEADIVAYCSNPEVYKAYIDHYIATGGWLVLNRDAPSSMDALVKLKEMNAYIWYKEAGDPTQIKVVREIAYGTSISQTIHMLWTNAGTHYNFLIEHSDSPARGGAGAGAGAVPRPSFRSVRAAKEQEFLVTKYVLLEKIKSALGCKPDSSDAATALVRKIWGAEPVKATEDLLGLGVVEDPQVLISQSALIKHGGDALGNAIWAGFFAGSKVI